MDKKLGIYIHIPFCASRCEYCDFYTLAGRDKLMPKYHEALLAHLAEAGPQLSSYYIDTLYFGGGTPSYYGAKRICEVFNALKRCGRVLKSAEVTVEVNPDSVTKRDLALLYKEGVNRLSIGMQSANDDLLKLIGRRHSFKQVEKAVRDARSVGFGNISLDLIYGLPSQTKSDWADTLAKALALKPEHLSCYGLKLEEGTPLYSYKGSPFLPDDDEQADMYLYMVETLENFGYPQYEISNFSLEGYQSRHNLKYWKLQDYMGFGPGAHSCVAGLRYSFAANLEHYISGVLSGGDILDEYEEISPLDRAAEYIMLGMRTVRGISGREYYRIYRNDFEPIAALLDSFRKKGWAEESANGRWRFTTTGFLLSNPLIGALLEMQSKQKLSSNPWLLEDEDDFVLDEEELSPPTGDELFF